MNMKKMSMSITKGRGNQKHNTRTQTAKPQNVDFSRTEDNITVIDENIKDTYHELFDSALEKYNAKQKRKDRKIKDYYSHIANSKKEKLFHELVVQIGQKDSRPDQKQTNRIYEDFVNEFIIANPQMKVIGAYVHNDEATPHLHLDYIPYTKGNKRGLETKISNDGAIRQMGYRNWEEWKEEQFRTLEKICENYSIKREHMNNTERHRTVEGYKQEQRAIGAKLNEISRELETSTREPKKGLFGKETIDYETFRALEQENTLQKAQISSLSNEIEKYEEKYQELKNKPYRLKNKELERINSELEYKNSQERKMRDYWIEKEVEKQVGEIQHENSILRQESVRQGKEIEKLKAENKKLKSESIDQEVEKMYIYTVLDKLHVGNFVRKVVELLKKGVHLDRIEEKQYENVIDGAKSMFEEERKQTRARQRDRGISR